MQAPQELPSAVRLMALACGLMLFAGGCGGEPEDKSRAEIGASQKSATDAWLKAKADGTDKRVNKQPTNPGRRGYTN